jgi:hypothetical protein
MAERRSGASGVRFLNATAEQDYGVHLFEDPKSHRIVAVTAAGKYHLRYLALNSEYLILKRKHRSMASGLRDKVGLIQGLSPYDTARLDDLLGNAESAIPPLIRLHSRHSHECENGIFIENEPQLPRSRRAGGCDLRYCLQLRIAMRICQILLIFPQ